MDAPDCTVLEINYPSISKKNFSVPKRQMTLSIAVQCPLSIHSLTINPYSHAAESFETLIPLLAVRAILLILTACCCNKR